jgi:hypothetical protein
MGSAQRLVPFMRGGDDSSDEEIETNNFVGETALGESKFHARRMDDTAMRRKLKAREAFTVPVCFL